MIDCQIASTSDAGAEPIGFVLLVIAAFFLLNFSARLIDRRINFSWKGGAKMSWPGDLAFVGFFGSLGAMLALHLHPAIGVGLTVFAGLVGVITAIIDERNSPDEASERIDDP